jgi:hypothetical protein
MTMPLTPKQIERLKAAAEAAGVDPGALQAAAEKLATAPAPAHGAGPGGSSAASSQQRQQLYQYHLPFLLVREVRAYLRSGGIVLDETFVGDAEVAGEWAAEMVTPSDAGAQPDAAGSGPGSATDAKPGDRIEYNDDGWHAYASEKHIGGPYKTRGKALRALRWYDTYGR